MVVTSDLATDQRVQRHAELLVDSGYELTLIGRQKKSSLPFNSSRYKVIRLKSLVEKGWFFYASYNVKLFWYLLFIRSKMIWSNDLDTLLPSFIVSRLKHNILIYDTHEYYTGVPELEDRPFVRSVWRKLEQWILPRIKLGLTVSDSVAERYKEEYGIALTTIRNMPSLVNKEDAIETRITLPEKPFIIYQGALNKDRGLEELIVAMQGLKEYALVIVGKGDKEYALKTLVEKLQLQDQVMFLGLLKPSVLRTITPKALIGVSIEKPSNLNYIMCLPNKLFDYIQAGIPIVAFPHPEIKKIIDTYRCGSYINTHNPEKMAEELQHILANHSMRDWREASKQAAEDLNWEKEKLLLLDWFEKVFEKNR